jgi:hypothetical protein
MNDVTEAGWHEWNINLADPAFSTVVKTNVTSIRIGFGGADGGGGNKAGGNGTMYFDDIQLWPSRCRPELPNATDFDDDCITGTTDLSVMANDWLFSDGYAKIVQKRDGTLMGNPTWVAGKTGNALQFDGVGDYVNVPDPCLTGAASMSITCWVKTTVANDWVGLVCSRENVGCGDDGSEIGLYGKAYGGPDGLGYDWSCGTEEWQFDAGLADPAIGVWTFCALAVDPTGASLYERATGGPLQIGIRNAVAHSVQKNFSRSFWIGRSKQAETASYTGLIDDVRIYDYALTETQVSNMSAAVPSDPNPWPVYWYKLDESSGTTAADSGYGANLYKSVASPANLTDPEAAGSRKVNFMDFAILADNWLEQVYWP